MVIRMCLRHIMKVREKTGSENKNGGELREVYTDRLREEL